MRLKRKVSKTPHESQLRVLREEAFLKLLESHISTLQGAKFGADGLASIHLFLVDELGDFDEDIGGERIHAGVEDICTLLARCLRRETDQMERLVWDRKALLGIGPRAESLKAARAARQKPSRKNPTQVSDIRVAGDRILTPR